MNMKKWLVVFFLFVTLLCQAKQRRALLVGVANYPEESGWRKIHADNDVFLLESVLYNSFSVKSIVDEKATLANILTELASLQKATCHGDTVLVSFSCHGQQMIPVGDGEPDSLDEALIPYDAKVKCSSDYHGENHLRDDILSTCILKIREAAGPNGLVIVLLDACHSGDSFRESFRDSIVMENYRGGYSVFGDSAKTARRTARRIELRNVFRITKSDNLSNVIFISACQSHQLGYEYQAKNEDNKWYGSLTYAFVKAYEKDGLNNIVSLCTNIKSLIESFQKSTRQSPEFATTIDSICEIEKVWGVITDANTGEVIIGANVKVKGTSTVALSDSMGKYNIVVNMGQTIEISNSDYITQSVLVGNQNQIDIKLSKDNKVESNDSDVPLNWNIGILVLVIVFLIAYYIWKKR